MTTFALRIKKSIIIVAALAFLASAYFLCSAVTYRLPRGVIVNGTDVGGLTFTCAERVLRRGVEEDLQGKQLDIQVGGQEYSYTFPEVYYADGFAEGLRRITKAGEYELPVHYYLNGAEEIAQSICRNHEVEVTEPYAVFNEGGEPFTYYDGCDGLRLNKPKLLDDVSRALNGGEWKVAAELEQVKRTTRLEDVKSRTVKLYSFTTYFDFTNYGRSSNIRLAASMINGTVLSAGEEFSFNAVVGERSAERGFQEAKIIEEGKFVQGIGGGVCQVSTTLYNAALLSGLQIAEYHPHSLAVSYVSPSRDAMVSGSYYDLKFINNRQTPIYIGVKCSQNSICCTVYGESDGYSYSYKSEVIGTLPRPDDVEVSGDEDKVLSYGRDGTLSLGYLIKEREGERSEELIRKDKYAPVAEVRQVKREDDGGENG